MMRGNRLALFKIDLSLWWYYGLILLATAVCYGEELLELAGISVDLSAGVSFFLFYGLGLVVMFGVNMLLRGKVEVTYGLVFDTLRPKEEETSNGVVLGNIFQM